MKRVFIISFFFLAALVTMQAQAPVRQWKMGPLTWNDFQPNSSIGDKHSHLEYYMGIQGSMEKHKGIKYLHPAVTAFMSNDFSWADTAYRTPQLLVYHQCTFDLVELHRRRLENYIFDGRCSLLEIIDPDQLLDNTMLRLADDVARLESETHVGTDSALLSQWQARVKTMLDSTPRHTFNHHADALFRWGFSFDLGYTFLGGGLQDYLGDGVTLGFTGDMGIGRHFLTTAMSIGGSRCRQQMLQIDERNEIRDLYPTDDVYHLDFYVGYGYAVIDNAHLRATPFVGYGWQQYYYNAMDESSHGPTDGGLHLGVDLHYIFSNQVEINEFLCGQHYNASHDIMSFHAKLYATYNRFNTVVGTPSGFSINLQLGIALMTGRAHCE